MSRKITLAAALSALCGAVLSADERIDRYVSDEMALNRIPGLSLALVENRRLAFAKAYGVRDTGSPEALRIDHPVELASVSKSFTALAILQLERAGTVNRHDSVTGILPELGRQDWQGVTLHDLLRHRSGLRRRHDFLAPCCDGRGTPDPEDAVRYLARADLEGAPGAIFSYANSNYVLLAAMVQRVSGVPFADYMRERVFRPLGLPRTTVDAAEARRWGSAVPHEWLWGRVRPSPSRFLGWPGSSLAKSSAEDMGSYMAKLLDPTPGHLASAVPDRPWWGQLGAEYDLGWAIHSEADWLDGEFVLEHTGKAWGGQTAVVLVPRRGAGVAVLINLGTDRAIDMARKIVMSRLGSADLGPARMSPFESPDNWAMAFLVFAGGLFGAILWYAQRVMRQLRSGSRAWRPTGQGTVRAVLLAGLAAVLVGFAFQGTGPPWEAQPSTVRVALPALVGGVSVLLAVVGGAALVPPKKSTPGVAGSRTGRIPN